EFMHQHFYRPIKELEFGRLVNHLLDITSRHELRLPPDFFSMLKAFSVTEGLMRSLDPEADLIAQAAPVVRRVKTDRLSPRRLVEDFVDAGSQFGALARDLPAEIRRLLAQVRSGEIRIVFRHDNLDPLMHSLDQTSNRLAYAIVLAALIIGSSLMVHADIPPRLAGIPVIGLAGFLMAMMMGFWLLIAIIRHGRMEGPLPPARGAPPDPSPRAP
ncbi:MAG: AarF/ABC1/UbiB kinase family protein, partial [Elusimicrobia bacterium]|nr:AarF/ABC1/UbiB kinase family protein [Elusimicrobiota bacterium]